MYGICEFFQEITIDCDILSKGIDSTEKIKNDRVQAIFSRVMGAAGLGVAVLLLATAAITIVTTPLSGIMLLTFSIFLAVISHDLIILGCNTSQELALLQNPLRHPHPILQTAASRNNPLLFEGAITGELHNFIPHRLQGTWLMEPIAACVIKV